MPKKSRPRHGSLAYTPRKRAPSQKPRVRGWPEDSSPRLQGFAGYKAGMTHLFTIDDRESSPTEGQEINVPATVIETPPLAIFVARIYGADIGGKRTVTEVWGQELKRGLERTVRLPKKYDYEKNIEYFQELIENGEADDIGILAHTQPKLSSVPKKKPEIVEIKVGGESVEDKWKYARDRLGNEIRVSEIFEEGKYVDVIAITKGKGTEGPVQRWGVKVQPRKVQKARRHVGVLGPWRPRGIMRSVPAAGQTGYHQRTEFNKRILKLGDNGKEITPDGGFLRFGEINGDFVILKGSVPGPKKRLVFLRRSMRRRKGSPTGPPTITYIHTGSQQGV